MRGFLRALASLIRWSVFTLGLAIFVHIATVAFLPQILMGRVMSKIDENVGSNTASYPPPANPENAGDVPQASPDLLYAVCRFALAGSAIRIVGPAPSGFWSLSMIDDNGEEFYSLSNRQTGAADRIDILLTGPATTVRNPPTRVVVDAQTVSGIVILRALAASPETFQDIDTQRRQLRCEPYAL